jgi:hypothetical protein
VGFELPGASGGSMVNTFPFRMKTASVLDWANSNAPAITALATVFLVLITAVYVAVTYLLVREQRSQRQLPKVHFFIDRRAQEETVCADLRIKNVSEVTATEVTFLRVDGISVDMPHLGRRISLLPGEDLLSRIRPPAGENEFADGDLPLILSYSDISRSIVVFDILLLKFAQSEGEDRVRNIGSMERIFTKRKLKKLTLSSLPLRSRLSFLWKARNKSVRALLLNSKVRAALRADFQGPVTKLRVAGDQMRELREQL